MVVLCSPLVAVQPRLGADNAQFVGAWKLVSWERDSKDLSTQVLLFGKNPADFLVFSPEGNRLHIVGDWTQAATAGKSGITGRTLST